MTIKVSFTICYGAGLVFRWLNRCGQGERIVLPLSSDGVSANGILGAPEYHYPRIGGLSSKVVADTEKWFCLRPKRPEESDSSGKVSAGS